MKEKVLLLSKKIDDIITRGWILVPRQGYGEVGLLFENLLGLSNNEFSVPDYDGIEIKVQRQNSKYPLTLFNCTCDGPNLFEIKRIVNKYGIINRTSSNTKVMFISLSCNSFSSWGRYLRMKLHIDTENEKLYILISHSNGKIIERKAYWDFSTLKCCLERKLKYLCYVVADSVFLNGKKFAKYDDVYFYKLKDFDNFIKLLQNGHIVVNIKYGVYKQGPKKGLPYDHGISFQILKSALSELYEIINKKSP